MRSGLISTAAAMVVLVSSTSASTDTSFKLSPESWQSRCPAIEKFEALDARGIYMEIVKVRAVYARYDNDPNGGTVVLDARIDTEGKVRDLQLVSSTSGALVGPVVRAVREWRYKPVVVDGKEVCVERRLEVPVTANPNRSMSPGWGATRRARNGDYASPPPPHY